MPFYNAKVNIPSTSTMSKSMANATLSKAGSTTPAPLKPNSKANTQTDTNAKVDTAAGLKSSLTALGPSPPPSSGNTTPSSGEENVRPSSPAQEEADHANRPTSPRPLSPQLKDVRAYEHERQRTKRAGEWALKRARKTSLGAKAKDGVVGGITGRKKGAQRVASGREDVDAEFVVGVRGPVAAAAVTTVSVVGEGESVKVSTKPEPLVMTLALPKDLNVSFSDLIVPPKSKSKAKKSKVKFSRFGSLRTKGKVEDDDNYSYADEDGDGDEEEFEWVPALRAVIVLEEVDPRGRRDMEVDEPWECVDENDDGEGEEKERKDRKKGLSYAEVVGGMHLD